MEKDKINKRRLGAFKESLAADYLKSKGVKILEQNYRCRAGEIDLIASDGEQIIFLEVKYRSSGSMGESLRAVDHRKRKVICKVAGYYLYSVLHSMDLSCRFDVIGIDQGDITWIQNAFDYEGRW